VAQVDAWVFTREGECEAQTPWVIQERPVTLYLNGQEMVTLLCSGHHLDELAAGFLYAEGFLAQRSDLTGLEVNEEQGRVDISSSADPSLANRLWQKRAVTSGCGKGTLFYHALDALMSRPVEGRIRVSPDQVWRSVQDLHGMSDTYRRTHGVHNTALASPEELVLFRDDIGRHNAVDMIVGHAFLNELSLDDKMLVTTGRLTSELLIKAAKVGLPMVVSRNTATELAVELARSLNITLMGYARAGKFTVYSGVERIENGPED
jgi:FdhD protein